MLKRIRAAREDGFTLTELLIVIVVLGILAGIVVFAVNTFADDSEGAACTADKKTVEVAAEAYRVREGKYPASIADLDTYLREPVDSTKYVFTTTGDGKINVGAGTGGGPPAGC